MNPRITVIICTRNRLNHLSLTLATLAKQKSSADWDLLIVDNGSTDGTASFVSQVTRSFNVPVKLIREEKPGLSFARNTGVKFARGDVIVFSDDDVNFAEYWIEAISDAFSDASVSGMAGRIIPLLPPSTPDWLEKYLCHEIGGPTARYDFGELGGNIKVVAENVPPFGANCAVRKDLIIEYGMFRTDLGWGPSMVPSEETNLFGRMMADHLFVYQPSATVFHRIDESRTSWKYYVWWQRAYGRGLCIANRPKNVLHRIRDLSALTFSWLKGKVRGLFFNRDMNDINRINEKRRLARIEGVISELIKFWK
ncbi:MAG: glycosyltransferase family 2 protein [Rhodospirillaceae bacterium]|jgi:glycosyltransferase involved in cell wall biosynthesis